MLRLLMPLLLLQVYCVFHAYRNNAEQKWYWMILFLPLVGCALYLYDVFYLKGAPDGIAEVIREVVKSNPRIEQLEKAHQFSDSVTNKTRLADAYVEIGRYEEAITLYKSCLEGFMADDVSLQLKLLQTYFQAGDYASTVTLGEQLDADKSFKNLPQRVSYAWALHYLGKSDHSEKIFRDMDVKFTNYAQRWEYCKLLSETKRPDELKSILSDLLNEFEHMGSTELKVNRAVISNIKTLNNTLKRSENAPS